MFLVNSFLRFQEKTFALSIFLNIIRINLLAHRRFLLIIVVILQVKEINSTKATMKRKFCQERSILLGSDINMAKVVDCLPSSFIELECNFCDEQNDQRGKIWYLKKRGASSKPKEILMDMNTEAADNRISVTSSHALIIANFSFRDSGIYSCHAVNTPTESIFTFNLEDVFISNVMPKIGKLSHWNEYKRINLDPINRIIETSNETFFQDLRVNFNFTFRVVTIWEPWGPCESYGRRKSHATKRKEGKCRLHPLLSNIQTPPSNDELINNFTSYYLIDNYDISCRSRTLNDTFPDLSSMVRNIPEFVETMSCIGTYVTASSVTLSKKTGYKYRSSKIIAEKSHLTFYCPEASLDSTVVWYKNKDVLNSSFRNNMADNEEEPNLTIDSFNSLYILHATKREEGVYACTVDGDKMQIFAVKVVSKSKMLSEEFFRYSIYLAFVLTLSLTCYCAGVCIAWRRKSSFADPFNVRIRDEAVKATKHDNDTDEHPLLF